GHRDHRQGGRDVLAVPAQAFQARGRGRRHSAGSQHHRRHLGKRQRSGRSHLSQSHSPAQHRRHGCQRPHGRGDRGPPPGDPRHRGAAALHARMRAGETAQLRHDPRGARYPQDRCALQPDRGGRARAGPLRGCDRNLPGIHRRVWAPHPADHRTLFPRSLPGAGSPGCRQPARCRPRDRRRPDLACRGAQHDVLRGERAGGRRRGGGLAAQRRVFRHAGRARGPTGARASGSAHPMSCRGRWLVLALLSLAIAGSYYEYDAIAPIAGFLHAARGFTQAQIGMLNAVFSLPNIVLALLGGVLIDRYGPARIATWTAALCLAGAVLTAVGSPYAVMVTGRLIFGVAEEALFIALLAGLAQWFSSGATAVAMALFFSFARIGSYAADTSPGWAHALYAHGWQMPLWLAAGATGASFAAALLYWVFDGRARVSGRLPPASAPERITWSDLVSFDLSYWYILALNVLFAAVFFPFRSTFAIEYFQDAKGLTLQQAGLANSW